MPHSSCAILSWAREQRATVVTLDADFHAMLAVSGDAEPSVIRLRLEGLCAKAAVAVIEKVLERYGNDLARGCLITVKTRKTTCHRLPVGRE